MFYYSYIQFKKFLAVCILSKYSPSLKLKFVKLLFSYRCSGPTMTWPSKNISFQSCRAGTSRTSYARSWSYSACSVASGSSPCGTVSIALPTSAFRSSCWPWSSAVLSCVFFYFSQFRAVRVSIGADFHRAMVATTPGEKLLIGRSPMRNWTQLFRDY